MSFEPQFKFRCYCGSKGGCFGVRQNYKSTKGTASSSSSTPTTHGAKRNEIHKFIKIKKFPRDSTVNSAAAGNKHGLGHSYSANNSCFSRRNSANSLGSGYSSGGSRIHFAPDNSSNGRRRVSIDSTTSTITTDPDSTIWSKKSEQDTDEYTDRRRLYERSKIFFQIDPELERAQRRADAGMGFIVNLNNVQSKLLREVPTNDVIAALQRFRLENPDDCFNIYRQNDLKMERRLSEYSSIGSSNSHRYIVPTDGGSNKCCCGCKCCSLAESKGKNYTKVPKKLSKTEDKKTNGDKKFKPLRPLDKSLALRFQSY